MSENKPDFSGLEKFLEQYGDQLNEAQVEFIAMGFAVVQDMSRPQTALSELLKDMPDNNNGEEFTWNLQDMGKKSETFELEFKEPYDNEDGYQMIYLDHPIQTLEQLARLLINNPAQLENFKEWEVYDHIKDIDWELATNAYYNHEEGCLVVEFPPVRTATINFKSDSSSVSKRAK